MVRTHGLADDALLVDRLVRSQSRQPDQLVIVGTPDPRVQAKYVPRSGRTAFDFQRAILLAEGGTVVLLDSAVDVLPDHVETMISHVAAGALPIPRLDEANGHLVPSGVGLAAFRLLDALGVGGFWPFLDRSEGPEVWAWDLLDRIRRKYHREVVHVPVRCQRLPGRAAPPMRQPKCGLSIWAMTQHDTVTARRDVPAALLKRLRDPCPFYSPTMECSLLKSPCVAPWAALGVDDEVVKWGRSLPAGRIRRAWHARRRKHGDDRTL